MKTKDRERILDNWLEDNSFDELLEYLNVDLYETFDLLYDEGFLDDALLVSLLPTD
jgi:hypothetical protein